MEEGMDFCKKLSLICTLCLLTGSVCLISCRKTDNSEGAANVQGDKLDRATAEKILRDHSDTLFRDDALTMDHVTVEQGEKDVLDRLPDVEFLQELAAAGVVRQRTDKQEGHDTVYYYAPIPQKGIKVQQPHDRFEAVIITLATKGIKRVTGISQQGTDADVEAEVGLIPTDLYNRILPNVRDTVAKCPPPNTRAPIGADLTSYYLAYFCYGRWPSEDKLSVVKTVTFKFKKFDDGWRLVKDDD
jgi:hypothetical protein